MRSDNSSVSRHYFDWAASAPPVDCPESDAVIGKTLIFGNPSSRHREGRAAKEALENARERCARVLGLRPETLHFTSGGTEANCIALYSNLFRPSGRLVSSRAEHPSVIENIDTLQRMGRPTGTLPLDSMGRVTPALLEKALKKYGDVRFAAVMAVNNETGAINDISSLRRALGNCGGPPVHLHCDMVQALGKISFDLGACDSASLSAHKIGGQRGIGLLYLNKPLEPLYSGGGQEGKIRPGTENVAGAIAFASCLERYADGQTIQRNYEAARKRCERFISAMSESKRCMLIPGGREASGELFSPYIVQLGFQDIPGEVMVRALDDAGFAVSTGSACSSAAPERPVLAAMGIDERTSRLGIRVSQGWSTSDEEIESLISAIQGVLERL